MKCLVLFLLFSVSLSFGQSYTSGIIPNGKSLDSLYSMFRYNVKDSVYGAKGDGSTLDSAAIMKAITAAPSGSVVFLPRGTYYTGELAMKTGVYLYSDNATLKAVANQATAKSVLLFSACDHTGVLGRLTIDGNIANQANKGDSGPSGIVVTNAAHHIETESITIRKTGGDGIYIGSPGPTPHDIYMRYTLLDSAWRNNLSVTNAYNIRFESLVATNAYGVAPKAGVDIEPNTIADSCRDISFGYLDVTGNVSAGLELLCKDSSGNVQGNFTVSHINATANGNGVDIENAVGLTISSGAIYRNTGWGVYIARDCRNLNVTANIYRNAKDGIKGSLTSQDFQSWDWHFTHCNIFDNGTLTPNDWDGVNLSSDGVAIENVVFDNCGIYSVGGIQRYPIVAGNGVHLVDCQFSSHGHGTSNSASIGGTATSTYITSTP